MQTIDPKLTYAGSNSRSAAGSLPRLSYGILSVGKHGGGIGSETAHIHFAARLLGGDVADRGGRTADRDAGGCLSQRRVVGYYGWPCCGI